MQYANLANWQKQTAGNEHLPTRNRSTIFFPTSLHPKVWLQRLLWPVLTSSRHRITKTIQMLAARSSLRAESSVLCDLTGSTTNTRKCKCPTRNNLGNPSSATLACPATRLFSYTAGVDSFLVSTLYKRWCLIATTPRRHTQNVKMYQYFKWKS